MSKPVCTDAFCGAGGLSLGLTSAGFDVNLAFDNDPLCIKTLRSNEKYIKHKVIKEDIASMLNGTLLDYVNLKSGDLDLLAGGPPCQGFSNQRTIGGDKDDRNLLVNDYGSLIREVMPRFFLMENVQGIGGNRGRAVLEKFCQEMTREGYFIHKETLDAQEYDVPQRRRRVIVIGERLNEGQPFFRWPAPSRKKARNVREVIGHLPPPPDNFSEHPEYPGHRADRLSLRNRERLCFLKGGQGRSFLPENLLADCHRASADTIGHRNVYGRMSWEDVAPTITARFDSFTRGKFGHPEQIRTISLYEGALLQTFPDDYRFVGNKVDVARQIGNAVPPDFGRAIGKAIIAALHRKKRK